MNINVIFLLLGFCKNVVFGSNALGCGGFIKSSIPIDYFKVEIKLYTRQGSLKYQTEGAPNNGYYFIPLYDKGSYLLKVEPPAGWFFEPSVVELNIDGKTDPCALSQDINFVFNGFSIQGKVLSETSDAGPSDVGVSLRRKGDPKTIVQQRQTEADGSFQFGNVQPGEYECVVEAYKLKSDVTVKQDSVRLPDTALVIAGYVLQGSVVSDEEPISGVQFILATTKKNTPKAACCDAGAIRKLPEGFKLPENLGIACVVSSDAQGVFRFPCVRTSLPVMGSYVIMPHFKSGALTFDTRPKSLPVTIEHADVDLDAPFEVSGFTVFGSIPGHSGVRVSVQDRPDIDHVTTDASGNFRFESMRSGTYIFLAEKPHLLFDPLEFLVTPNTHVLSKWEPSKYEVCGQVNVAKGTSAAGVMLIVKSVDERYKQEINAQTSGKFCVMLPKGKFVVVPSTSSAAFVPLQQNIVVPSPDYKLVFTQFIAKVSGSVKCLDRLCSPQIKISLEPGHKALTVSDNGKFEFSDVFPGKYELCVRASNLCFERECLPVIVEDKDVKDLTIKQTGYLAQMESTHDTEIKIEKVGSEFLKVGMNEICLKAKGVYKITPLGCHVFKDAGTLVYNTAVGGVLRFVAEKHTMVISIVSPENSTDLKMVIKSGNEEIVHPMTQVSKKASGEFVYKLELMRVPNEELELRPQSSTMLFSPEGRRYVTKNDCDLSSVVFNARRGLFITGETRPSIADVTITVRTSDGRELKTKTDTNGAYKLGPLDSDLTYKTEASKEGYVFKQASNQRAGVFSAFKFASVRVLLRQEDDGSGSAKDHVPMEGALVSLSGGTDYRNNVLSGADGRVVFQGLMPGHYFLRPIMKEFVFEPASRIIDVKEGVDIDVVVQGRRVAYSCYGQLTSITGEAEGGVVMEAVGCGEEQHEEEAVSDEGTGKFRIRGLRKGCEYQLRMKADANPHIERSLPTHLTLKVNEEDIHDVKMILFRPYVQTHIMATVHTKLHFIPYLTVQLVRGVEEAEVFSVPALELVTFPPVPLDGRTYTLRLDFSQGQNYRIVEMSSITFVANETFRHFDLRFEAVAKMSGELPSQEMSSSKGGSVVILGTLLLAICVYYREKLACIIASAKKSSAKASSPNIDDAKLSKASKVKAKRI